jgi:hypothetical protein
MCLLFSGEGIPALASVFAVQEKFEDKLSGGGEARTSRQWE